MLPSCLPRFPFLGLCALLLAAAGVPVGRAGEAAVPSRPVRVMAVGDSITAGADFFTCYRFALWEKLFAAGYVVEFVGTQQSETRIGPLAHEGYGGKNTEFLARTVPEHFRVHPADIVLLHSGHNHTVEEHPVPGILAATEQLITALRTVNPRVTVLLAQVIPAGKLPKYAYLPDLNTELARLAARLDQPQQRVVLVDQADGFDWATDTVEDKVHPNARGAEKMARVWFETLQKLLPPPPRRFTPERITYLTADGCPLALHVFRPRNPEANAPGRGAPAVLFFFGGGWTHGTPIQFYPECAHFADRGFVALSADYRVAATHGSTPRESAADARAAYYWVRAHATELGIDPARIVLAGASAGGQLAAFTALTCDGPGPAPAALLLWYPVLDTGPQGYGQALFGAQATDYSPLALLARVPLRLPPTLIMAGTADPLLSGETLRQFQSLARAHGRRCETVLYPEAGHPLYAYREGGGVLRTATLQEADRFLATLPAFDAARH